VNVLKSNKTLCENISRHFQNHTVDHLHQELFQIHSPFDLWTSLNFKEKLAMTTAYWIAPDFTTKEVFLVIREIQGQHTRDDISEVVIRYGEGVSDPQVFCWG